jgi:hypothetical protein
MKRDGADGRPDLFAAAWLLLAVALCAAVGFWGVNIGRALGPEVQAAPRTVVPRATAAPNIVTDYTDDGTATTESLCAELSPAPIAVIVESQTGTVISTARCPSPSAFASDASTLGSPVFSVVVPDAAHLVTTVPNCQFVQNDDGSEVVMSVKTGSLFSEAQGQHCTN